MRWMTIGTCFVAMLMWGGTVHGAKEEKGFPFKVEPVWDESQVKGDAYFHQEGTPGEKGSVTWTMVNTSDHAITVETREAIAETAKNGGIHYKPTSRSFLAVEQREVRLEVGESKTMKATYSVPSDATGTLLGGIVFSEKESGKEGNETGFSIRNRTEFALAVQLDIKGEGPKGEIVIQKAKATYTPSGLTVSFEVKNDSTAIRSFDRLHYTITDRGETIRQQGKEEGVKMAPDSTMTYETFWDGRLKTGKYVLNVTLEDEGGTVKQSLPFTVKNQAVDQVKRLESSDPKAETERVPGWVWFLAGIGGAGLLMMLAKKKAK